MHNECCGAMHNTYFNVTSSAWACLLAVERGRKNIKIESTRFCFYELSPSVDGIYELGAVFEVVMVYLRKENQI